MRKILLTLMVACMLLTLTGCTQPEPAPVDPNQPSIAEATCLADLAGFKIAAQAGTFHADALNQIENVQGSTYPEFTDLLIALQSKAIDGYIAEEPTALSVCGSNDNLTYVQLVNNQTGFTASEEDTGVAVGLVKGSELTAQINAILEPINVDVQRELMSQIITVCNGGTVEAFNIQTELPLEYKGVFRVGMECAYEPYNWTETGAQSVGCVPIYGEGKEGLYANGFDVQIAQYIANQLGYKLEVYSIEWDSLIPALQSGTVDAIIAGMSPTAERKETIDFTNCYYNSNLVVIIRNED